MNLDHRYLPPKHDGEPNLSVDPVGPQCQSCGEEQDYLNTVTYQVCGNCTLTLPPLDGMTVIRSKTAELEDVSNYGDHDDPESWFRFARNAMDHKVPLQDQLNRVVPGGRYTWNPVKQHYEPEPPPKTYTSPVTKRGERPHQIPGSQFYHEKNTRVWDKKPTMGDPPGLIFQYIQDNYSPTEIKERYSEIKDELLYPVQSIQVTIDDEQPKSSFRREGSSVVGPGSSVTYTVNDGIHVLAGGGAGGSFAGEFISEGVAGGKSYLTGMKPSAIIVDEELHKPESEDEMSLKPILSAAEAQAAYKEAARALAEVERLNKKYSPDLPNGSVISFRIQFPSTTNQYLYAAVKAAGKWFVTGKFHPNIDPGVGMDWTDMLSVFERFICSDFEVLKAGSEQAELSSGSDVPEGVTSRKVEVPEDKLTAFEEPQTKSPGVEIISDSFDRDYENGTNG